MKILVVGSGGREHALCWKIAQSKKVSKIYCAPGNAGVAEVAECVSIGAMEFDKFVEERRIEYRNKQIGNERCVCRSDNEFIVCDMLI